MWAMGEIEIFSCKYQGKKTICFVVFHASTSVGSECSCTTHIPAVA